MLDKYFYSIELDENQNKMIHLLGNIYYNDVEENFTIAEWCFFYIKPDKAKRLFKEDEFFLYVDEHVKYIGDLTEEEALRLNTGYFNEYATSTELEILDITEDTPCGNYYFNRRD